MPMCNSREAPRFSPDPSGFDSFFEDVEELATRAALNDADKIKWAIRYAGSEADSWRHVPCLATGVAATATFQQFKTEVTQNYPQLTTDRRHTYQDLERLVNRTRDFTDMTREDIGDYYRRFITYSNYLMARSRLSERERNAAYLRGFPQPVRTRILNRLSIKKPDILPEDGYSFLDIHDAALFVSSAGNPPPSSDFSSPSVKSEPESDKLDKLLQVVTDMARVYHGGNSNPGQQFRPRQPAPGGSVPKPSQWGPSFDPDQGPRVCMFCSDPEHMIRECPGVQHYLTQGKIIRNSSGRLCLPDGKYPPKNTPGKNMRERIDYVIASMGIPAERESSAPRETVMTNFLETTDAYAFTVDAQPATQPSSSGSDYYSDNSELQELEAQIESLRDKHAQVLAMQKKQ